MHVISPSLPVGAKPTICCTLSPFPRLVTMYSESPPLVILLLLSAAIFSFVPSSSLRSKFFGALINQYCRPSVVDVVPLLRNVRPLTSSKPCSLMMEGAVSSGVSSLPSLDSRFLLFFFDEELGIVCLFLLAALCSACWLCCSVLVSLAVSASAGLVVFCRKKMNFLGSQPNFTTPHTLE